MSDYNNLRQGSSNELNKTNSDDSIPNPGKLTRVEDLTDRIHRKDDGTRSKRSVRSSVKAKLSTAENSHGTKLPSLIRSDFEKSLGLDLDGVRIHTGTSSAVAAQAVGAKAYTVGSNIHFGAGRFDLSSPSGKHLLAHEVAHTVQQKNIAPVRQNKLEISQAGDSSEVEADRAADAMITGVAARVARGSSMKIAREPLADNESQAAVDGDHDASKDKKDGGDSTEITPEQKQLLAKLVADLAAKQSVIGRLSSSATAAAAAIKRADSSGLGAAGARAVSCALAIERKLADTDTAIGGLPEKIKTGAEVVAIQKTQAALDKNLTTAGASAISMISIPGVQTGEASGGTISAAIQAKVASVRATVQRVASIKARATGLAGMDPKAQLIQAQQIAALMDSLGSDKAYARQVLTRAGMPTEVLAFINGSPAALPKKAADPQLGSGAKAAPPSMWTAPPKLADSRDFSGPGGRSGGMTADGSGKLGGDGKKTLKGLGNVTVSGGANVDVGLDKDGNPLIQGVRFNAGYQMPGSPRKISLTAGRSVTITPPVFNGKTWVVSYTINYVAGVGHSTNSLDKSVKANHGGSIMGTHSRGGSKVFDGQDAAAAFYNNHSFEGMDLPDAIPETASAAKELQEGERRTFSVGGKGGASVGGSSLGASVGVGAGIGERRDAELEKKEGGVIQVTVRGVTDGKVTGSMSAPGIGAGVGGAKANASAVTVSFDLNTAAGQAAYEKWQATPMVKPDAGPGVTVISTGEGTSRSNTKNLAIGWGKGTTTSTAGEYTQESADKKHKQGTVYGSHAVKTEGFDLSKRSQSHAIEVTTTDNGEPQYVVTTTVDAKDSATETNKVLANDVGEGEKYWRKGTSSGKYAVKSSYSKKQMDEFMAKVEDGSYQPSSSSMEVGDTHAEDLRNALKNATTEHQRQEALTQWYSERGPKARSDLRTAVGDPEKTEVSLENDKHLNGAVGQAQFNAKFTALQARFRQPELDQKAETALLSDSNSLLAELQGKRRHIQNPTNYPELPDRLRGVAVAQVGGNQVRISQLIANIRDHLKGQGIDSLNGDVALATKAVGAARTTMENALELTRAHRDIHAGKGATSVSSARETIERYTSLRGAVGGSSTFSKKDAAEAKSQGLSANQRMLLLQSSYRLADKKWDQAIAEMKKGEVQERHILTADTTEDAGIKTAIAAAKAAEKDYQKATQEFRAAGDLYAAIARDMKEELPGQVAGYELGHANYIPDPRKKSQRASQAPSPVPSRHPITRPPGS